MYETCCVLTQIFGADYLSFMFTYKYFNKYKIVNR